MGIDAAKTESKRKFNPEIQTPLLNAHIETFLAALDEKFHPYIRDSLITRRHPNGKLHNAVDLLEADSIREQLISLQNKYNPGEFAHLLSLGHVVKVDGIKTQAVSKYAGDEAGDAYVAANFEIMLMVAQKLDCDITVGVYSGDENVGLILPRTNHVAPTQTQIEQTFAEMNDLYYRNGNTQNYFKEIHDYLKESEKIELGTTFKIKQISDAKIHKPPKDFSHYRERTLLAGFIDNAEDKANYDDSIPLLTAIQGTLLKTRTIHAGHARSNPVDVLSWPRKYQDLYAALETDFDKDTDEYNQALSYLELSVYEPIYSGDLKVRKFQNLEQDVNDAFDRKKTVQMVRFADTELKGVNETSHLLGDYHMIATVREVQNYLWRRGFFKDMTELHSCLKFYQHHGSFMMSIETGEDRPELAGQIIACLDDPLTLNTDILNNAVAWNKIPTTSDHLHALPYIVATTHYQDPIYENELEPIILRNKNDMAEFFNANHETLDKIKATQIKKEAQAVLQGANCLNLVKDEIIGLIDTLGSSLTQSAHDQEIASHLASIAQVELQIKSLSIFFENLIPTYFGHRLGRTNLLLESPLYRVRS